MKFRVLIKLGVTGDLLPVAQKGFGRVAKLYEHKGCDCIILTSKREGNHGYGSLHYIGLAFDIAPDEKVTKEEILGALGMGWQVIHEGDHVHSEYDP